MEYKNICFAILNEEDAIGDIMKNLSSNEVLQVKDINLKTKGKAFNFKMNGNRLICDIKVEDIHPEEKTLSYAFKPIKTKMKGQTRIIEEAELQFLFLSDNHMQTELNNNLKEEK